MWCIDRGFDVPPACIVLTRPCSYKSTMVQMIGRGLRTIDQRSIQHHQERL